jgi:hypothetical protein
MTSNPPAHEADTSKTRDLQDARRIMNAFTTLQFMHEPSGSLDSLIQIVAHARRMDFPIPIAVFWTAPRGQRGALANLEYFSRLQELSRKIDEIFSNGTVTTLILDDDDSYASAARGRPLENDLTRLEHNADCFRFDRIRLSSVRRLHNKQRRPERQPGHDQALPTATFDAAPQHCRHDLVSTCFCSTAIQRATENRQCIATEFATAILVVSRDLSGPLSHGECQPIFYLGPKQIGNL